MGNMLQSCNRRFGDFIAPYTVAGALNASELLKAAMEGDIDAGIVAYFSLTFIFLRQNGGSTFQLKHHRSRSLSDLINEAKQQY